MPIKRCPLGSSECALFIVAQLLPRLLGGKSSVATKTHSEEQKSNSKGQQALGDNSINEAQILKGIKNEQPYKLCRISSKRLSSNTSFLRAGV
ncbi:hypothetical protein CKO50_16960 [Pseudoalteromonas sp. HM-SA03]|nr:hypothetical protein CKO50_16960 [Pseudoalteromonas sp. HM-SA03]